MMKPTAHQRFIPAGDPIVGRDVVTGTLEIYYCPRVSDNLVITGNGGRSVTNHLHATGECHAEQLREMANKAELRALQSKINPHFCLTLERYFIVNPPESGYCSPADLLICRVICAVTLN